MLLGLYAAFAALCALGGWICLRTRGPVARSVVLSGIAIFAVSPLYGLAKQTKTFWAAHQTEVGPAGSSLLPPQLVSASRHVLAQGGTWALWTPPIRLPDSSPDAPGLLAAARAMRSQPQYLQSDAHHMSRSLIIASSYYCGDVADVAWLAYELMPHPLNCSRPTYLICYRRAAPPGSAVVASGHGWEVVKL